MSPKLPISLITCRIRNVVGGIIDIIFPSRCIICGVFLNDSPSPPFCTTCLSGIHHISSPQCTRCGIPFPDSHGENHLCGECISTEQPFSIARALGKYEGTLLTAIHRFKYGRKISAGTALGRIMAHRTCRSHDFEDFSLVIPVPLHTKRLRERGFNQSVILAREIARAHNIPLNLSSLERKVDTQQQTQLKKNERGQNVRGAFALTKPGPIEGKKILLIDDVFTTGSTVRECARVLIRNGAKEVAALTVARAIHHNQ